MTPPRTAPKTPFGNQTPVDDYFPINAANEYTQINRASSNTNPVYDAAGNMIVFPVIPGADTEAGNKVNVGAQYDAFNQMQLAQAGSNYIWDYRYDALGRRIVEWTGGDGFENDFDGTQFIHEGYSVIMERKFTEYLAEIGEGEYEIQYPSTDDAHSKAHKIFVRVSILFSAVDGDLDGYIGAGGGDDQTTVNKAEFDYDGEAESGEAAVEDRLDFAYYYLDDARGRVMALLARDVEEDITPPETEGEFDLPRILEYYTYNAFGTVTALPVQDRAEATYTSVGGDGWYSSTGVYPGSGSLDQWDRMEDTPLDLSDNFQLMYNRRVGDNNHVASGQHYGRESAWANQMVSSGRRWNAGVGVQFCEHEREHDVNHGGIYLNPSTGEISLGSQMSGRTRPLGKINDDGDVSPSKEGDKVAERQREKNEEEQVRQAAKAAREDARRHRESPPVALNCGRCTTYCGGFTFFAVFGGGLEVCFIEAVTPAPECKEYWCFCATASLGGGSGASVSGSITSSNNCPPPGEVSWMFGVKAEAEGLGGGGSVGVEFEFEGSELVSGGLTLEAGLGAVHAAVGVYGTSDGVTGRADVGIGEGEVWEGRDHVPPSRKFALRVAVAVNLGICWCGNG